jgi:hypothetical protein
MPKINLSIDLLIFPYYTYFVSTSKPYHLLFSPLFDVLIGISYDPPLTDPFKFINRYDKLTKQSQSQFP